MLILKTLADLIISVTSAVCMVFYWMIILRIILSWIGVHPATHYNALLAVLYQVSDAVLVPFQRLPLRFGMIDFSPIVAIVVLHYIPLLVHALLYTLLGYA